MQSAIFMKNGMLQVVLTPENDFEAMALSQLHGKSSLSVFKGSFYQCKGGWNRQGDNDDSTIIWVEQQDGGDDDANN